MIPLLFISGILAGDFSFDRVDIISEDPATFINYDLPNFGVNTTTSAIRFVEQIKLVFETPLEGLSIGASIGSQSVFYEKPIKTSSFYYGAGIQSALLLPRGIFADLSWRPGPMRIALGVSMVSSATWTRPDWTAWDVLPTLGIGIGPNRK